jgi:serine/threonine protein kinase/tetratricopeptide (TPR) repeat protein
MNDSPHLGPFVVGERIGEGGMGSVYRGEHRETGVPVAIKVARRAVDQQTLEQFHREVQAHAALTHPGIVYLFEYGQIDDPVTVPPGDELVAGSPFVAMEVADRGTVRDALPFTDWESLHRLLLQTLDALAFAHARDVVHRDLKPENLLVFEPETGSDGREARIKLADFGIAHAFERTREADTHELRSPVGTPLYMAPEQFRGEWRSYGPWTDLYALGCIAWELVCGRPPFDGDSVFEIGKAHERDTRPPLDPKFPVPDGLASWIRRCLAVDPDRRFRRAADAAWELPSSEFFEPSMSTRDPGRAADASNAHSETLPDETLVEPTRTPSLASTLRLETAPADDRSAPAAADEPPRDEDPPAEAGDVPATEAELPPIPPTWKTAREHRLPTPLVGAGLGLFGLREPPFVDRDAERDRIWAALRRVVDGGALEMGWLVGDPGTGKSRLVEWMVRRAHELGAARVLRAVHTASGGRPEGLAGLVERHFQTWKLDRDELADYLTEHLPPLDTDDTLREADARALTEFLRPTEQDADEVVGPRVQFTDAEQRHAVVVRFFRRLARRRPLVVWLDDLQWGDEAIGLLEYLCELPDPPAMLVLGTLRTDILSERPQMRERLERLEEGGPVFVETVEPLGPDHHKRLLDGLLPLEDELADRLADRTEGHPTFAMQLLAHWIDDDALQVGPDGFRVADGHAAELPADIHRLWLERIDRVCETAAVPADDIRRALELAAALGREVDPREWHQVVDEADLQLPAHLVDTLVARGLAEWGDEGWAFAHGLLLESLERMAREAGRWQEHHRLCARTLGRQIPERPGIRERIADHWIQGERPERALDLLIEEARLLWRHGRSDEMRRVMDRHEQLVDRLALPDDDPRRLALHLVRARRWSSNSNYDDAMRAAETVLERAAPEEVELRAEAFRLRGLVHRLRGETEAAIEAFQKAIREAREADAHRTASDAHTALGWVLYYRADFERALEQAERALEAARRGNHTYSELSALSFRASMLASTGEGRRAERELEQLRREASEAGYRGLESQALNSLAERARFSGRTERARRLYRECLPILRELGDRHFAALLGINLTFVELDAGDLEAAHEWLVRSEEAVAAVGARHAHRDLLRCAHLTHAAGTGDWQEFDDLWSAYETGWPEEARLYEDHPWILEVAGEFCLDGDRPERARRTWRLAADLARRIDELEAAERLEQRLDQLP